MGNKRRIDTYIFDADGTLLDSLPDATAAVNATLHQFGYPPVTQKDTAGYIHDGAVYLMMHAAGISDQGLAGEMEHYFHKYYYEHSHTRLFPGVAEVLQALQNRGKQLGVFSNKPLNVLSRQLEFCGILRRMDFVRGDDGHTPLKPAPDAILQILKDTGTAPEYTVMVGDSAADLAAARAAGIQACFATYGIGSLPKGEEACHIDDITRLLELFC